MKTVIVVSRYGGLRHLADVSRQWDDGRFLTLCGANSAWTINSWRRHPDHPFLTPTQMEALTICVTCVAAAERENRPESVTDQSQTWLAVIHRKTVGGVDKIVGPFATEERAMHWLESMQKPGSVHQMVVLS
jgi:hypothetical protein